MIMADSDDGKVFPMQVRSSRGFTLIEVLVVVVILAILARPTCRASAPR